MRISTNGKKKRVCPLKLAKLAAPVFENIWGITKTRPLFTKNSLSTMDANGRFSHDKATMSLGYSPRDMKDTIADTISYLYTRKCDL
jgi:dihydroflavonol-4-reductase